MVKVFLINNDKHQNTASFIGEIIFQDENIFKIHTSNQVFSKKDYNWTTVK